MADRFPRSDRSAAAHDRKNVSPSRARRSGTMMVTITAIMPSKKAPTRMAVLFCSRIVLLLAHGPRLYVCLLIGHSSLTRLSHDGLHTRTLHFRSDASISEEHGE
jgi:hypothetical protein